MILDGFILVDKPKGMTSFKLCNIIKKRFNFNKVGHSGTLDPDATGLMIVGFNKGLKLMKLINETKKEYFATITFGYDSNTLDISGNITKEIDMNFNIDELKEKIDILKLRETQIPPMTSAIKINGKKLYEYQRDNIDIELKERFAKIYNIEILSDLRNIDNHLEIDIKLMVSNGFYIRSFARDLGILLNGCAIIKELRRLKIEDFDVSDAKPLDDINESSFISIFELFKFNSLEVDDYISHLVKNGVELDERQSPKDDIFYVTHNNEIIALYEKVNDNKYKPLVIF